MPKPPMIFQSTKFMYFLYTVHTHTRIPLHIPARSTTIPLRSCRRCCEFRKRGDCLDSTTQRYHTDHAANTDHVRSLESHCGRCVCVCTCVICTSNSSYTKGCIHSYSMCMTTLFLKAKYLCCSVYSATLAHCFSTQATGSCACTVCMKCGTNHHTVLQIA